MSEEELKFCDDCGDEHEVSKLDKRNLCTYCSKKADGIIPCEWCEKDLDSSEVINVNGYCVCQPCAFSAEEASDYRAAVESLYHESR